MDAKEVRKDKLLSKPANRGTEAKLRIFLQAYGKTGRITRACEMAKISFVVHYRRLQSDPTYRAAFEEAEQQAAQQLEDAVYDYAVDGDVQAALALLKRFRPELYRERASIDITGEITIRDALNEARARVIALEQNDRTGTQG